MTHEVNSLLDLLNDRVLDDLFKIPGEGKKYLVRIIKVPKNMRGRKIADMDRDIGPLREEDVLVVSYYIAKALERMGIVEIYSPVEKIKQPPKTGEGHAGFREESLGEVSEGV